MQHRQQHPKHTYSKSKFVDTPAINTMVQELVNTRCRNDCGNENNNIRHCCALFVEKSQSCFKPGIKRYESRELFPNNEKFPIPKEKLQGQESYSFHTCRGDGHREVEEEYFPKNYQFVAVGYSY